MGYKNAKVVIPKPLAKELQKYAQGDYLHVPTDNKNRQDWGAKTGAKGALADRNKRITQDFQCGCTIEDLAEKHYLSVHTIRKIVYKK